MDDGAHDLSPLGLHVALMSLPDFVGREMADAWRAASRTVERRPITEKKVMMIGQATVSGGATSVLTVSMSQTAQMSPSRARRSSRFSR
jgi:hypothetical protein